MSEIKKIGKNSEINTQKFNTQNKTVNCYNLILTLDFKSVTHIFFIIVLISSKILNFLNLTGIKILINCPCFFNFSDLC